jgi:hypothetical protein
MTRSPEAEAPESGPRLNGKHDLHNGEGTYSKRYTTLSDAHLKLIKESIIYMRFRASAVIVRER